MLKYLKEYRWADMRQMRANSRAEQHRSDVRMEGKHCVITGATSGVGWEAAKSLAAHGAAVVMINRNPEKSEQACAHLREAYGAECSYRLADFSDLSQVRGVADALSREPQPIDVLVNNVGMHSTRLTRTPEGRETVFCVNHLASFALTWKLLDTMRRSAPSRIIQVNSQGHRFGGLDADDLDWRRRHYTGLRGYGAAKTAQLLTVWRFAKLLEDSGVTINAMHPGAVRTNIGSNNGPLYRWYKARILSRTLSDPAIAGQAIHYLAAAPELAGVSGRYFNLTHSEKPAPHALDRDVGQLVWDESLRLAGLA
ncbi:MAG: SDR family NAD(P)-dependent oxidoreductase [Candidatus Bipolaricaulia bacterium]